MGAWIHFLYKNVIVNFAFALCKCSIGKIAKKVWVLAPITLKSMGAEAPTAPILTGALTVSGQWILMQCSQFSKDWAKSSGFDFQSNTHCLKLCYFDWQAYGFLRTLYAAQMVNLGAYVLNSNWLGCRYHVMWVANSMKDAVLVLWKLESWLFYLNIHGKVPFQTEAVSQ